MTAEAPPDDLPALDRAAILAVDDIPRRKIPIPEWRGAVWVRAMTASEREMMEQLWHDAREEGRASPRQMRQKIAALCLCDEHGKSIMTDADVAALDAKNGTALDRILPVVQELSGMGSTATKRIAGNS